MASSITTSTTSTRPPGADSTSTCAARHQSLSGRRDSGLALDRAVQVPLAGLLTYTETVRPLAQEGQGAAVRRELQQPSCAPSTNWVKTSAAAKRGPFIERLTQRKGKGRQLIRSTNYFNLTDAERAQPRCAAGRLPETATGGPGKDDFYAVEDVCGRVAGIGSMGRFRYVVLIAGKGSAEARNVLLELKESRPSLRFVSPARHRTSGAGGAAERVVTVQRLSQAANNQHSGWRWMAACRFRSSRSAAGRPHQRQGAQGRRPRWGGPGAAASWPGCIRLGHCAQWGLPTRSPSWRTPTPIVSGCWPSLWVMRMWCQRDYTRFVGARAELDRVSTWAGAGEPAVSP